MVLRSAIQIFSTLAVVIVIFVLLVWHAQPAAPGKATATSQPTPTPLSSVQSNGGLGPGKGIHFEKYDEGKLSSIFSATEFTPQKDGSFLVDHPVSIFYMGTKQNPGQYMRVTGDNGTVNCDSPTLASGKGTFAASPGSPRNGWLHHVRIEHYDSAEATAPSLWMETDNIHFDNDTLRMYTESFVDADGKTIAADQVPVKARGDDYEFDGKGLTLWWNGRDDRLQMLEIYHGQRLEIKNPSRLSLPGMSKPDGAPVVTVNRQYSSAPSRVDSPRSSGQVSLVSLTTPTAAKPAPKIVTPYRAVFKDDVKITQVDQQVGSGDTMTIDFLQGENKPATVAADPVLHQEKIPTPAENVMTPQPATAPVVSAAAPPSTRPATEKKMTGPVTITWTGTLTIKPLETEPLMPLLPGQSVVQLVGSPARLTPENSILEAASATYRSPDDKVELRNSPALPVVRMTRVDPKTRKQALSLVTGSLSYEPATSIATLIGPSELQVATGDQDDMMDVTWNKLGQLHMPRLPSEQQPRGVDHVDLAGNVMVNHPKFNLNARELQLDLDLIPGQGAQSKDTTEQLKKLTAIDDVKCNLIHPGKPVQGINSDKLVINMIRTADKRTVPREVLADGNVVAFVNDSTAPRAEPQQQLTAGHLQAFLSNKPAAASSTKQTADDLDSTAELESLTATDHVVAMLNGGKSATADQLRVTTVDGKQQMKLSGPAGAVLSDGKGSSLSGATVNLTSDKSVVTKIAVVGAGSMKTVHTPGGSATTQPATDAHPLPVDIAWTDSMSLSTTANIADVVGHVVVTKDDAAGNHTVVTSDTAHLDLVNDPKQKKKTTTDATASAMDGKLLKQLKLNGNVHLVRDLIDSSGTVLRHTDVYGDQLIYTAGTTVDHDTAEIPGAGKMFMENHQSDSKDAGQSKGAIAISWENDLLYDQSRDNITIQGKTAVGFEQEAKPDKDGKSKPASSALLNADKLIITMAKAPTSGPATKHPAAPADEAAGKQQLSRVTASGQVVFHAQALEMTCATVDYDPATSLMTAHGTPQQRGQTFDASHSAIGSFDELIYNVKTQQVVSGTRLQGQIQR